MAAVVVTETLDWKLHGFDLLSEHALTGGRALTTAATKRSRDCRKACRESRRGFCCDGLESGLRELRRCIVRVGCC